MHVDNALRFTTVNVRADVCGNFGAASQRYAGERLGRDELAATTATPTNMSPVLRRRVVLQRPGGNGDSDDAQGADAMPANTPQPPARTLLPPLRLGLGAFVAHGQSGMLFAGAATELGSATTAACEVDALRRGWLSLVTSAGASSVAAKLHFNVVTLRDSAVDVGVAHRLRLVAPRPPSGHRNGDGVPAPAKAPAADLALHAAHTFRHGATVGATVPNLLALGAVAAQAAGRAVVPDESAAPAPSRPDMLGRRALAAGRTLESWAAAWGVGVTGGLCNPRPGAPDGRWRWFASFIL